MTCRMCMADIDRRMVNCPGCGRVLDAEPTYPRVRYSLPGDFMRDMLRARLGHAVQIMDGLTGEAFYLQKISLEEFQAQCDKDGGEA